MKLAWKWLLIPSTLESSLWKQFWPVLTAFYPRSNLTFGEDSFCINFSFSAIFSLVFNFLEKQYFYWSNVLWKESDFWNVKNRQSWWERGHFGWIVKSQKGEMSKFEPPLFAFFIFSLQKCVRTPTWSWSFWLCLGLIVLKGFYERQDYLVKWRNPE